MPDSEITIDQLRAERDAARQEADQNAALVGELREAVGTFLAEMVNCHPEYCDHDKDNPGVCLKDMRERHYLDLSSAISVRPPAALERVRREAAAKENDYWAEEHEGLLGGHVSAQHVVRAAELREASHG